MMPLATCDALVQGANQIIEYADGCMVEIRCKATYFCEDKYELKDGDKNRTCEANNDEASWSGTAPKCDLIQGMPHRVIVDRILKKFYFAYFCLI